MKGLKQLFPSKVAVFSLDEDSSRRRGLRPDYVVRIGYQEIEPEDIHVLRDLWDLSDIAVEAAFSLEAALRLSEMAEGVPRVGAGRGAGAQRADRSQPEHAERALQPPRTPPALRLHGRGVGARLVRQILDYLSRGIHVVLEFGRYGSDVSAYVLVANLLTRRIHERYAQMGEAALSDGTEKPRPLLITIEEAHKYLSKGAAGQTIFGAIAREMRKHNVTLMVVDQRPSGIDDEVMSQLGTKVTCLLDNERDIDAVLTGVSGSRKLRGVLARLESKQQALVFGHALPMPVVIRTRDYGTPDSYRELGWADGAELKAQLERDVEELFGPPAG